MDRKKPEAIAAGRRAGKEVKKLFPEFVKKDDQGFMSVNYSGLIPVSFENINEQQRQIVELKKKLKNS